MAVEWYKRNEKILEQFATGQRVNIYSFDKGAFETKKIKNTFAQNDIFDEELEAKIATKIEGPFGDLLNHKLLTEQRSIMINRDENLLMREFILPKLQGISMMDQVGNFYKQFVLSQLMDKLEESHADEHILAGVGQWLYGTMSFCDNFSVYPLSPTRVLVHFSQYFKAFFPIVDNMTQITISPPLLKREQFDKHFFKPMRMELFEPCDNLLNKVYRYNIKKLTADEVEGINALMLDTETDEFAFRDFNRIRQSFWYYDHILKTATEKIHDFGKFE